MNASTVQLVCWDCGETFELKRRRGQYPRKCTDCRKGRRRQRRGQPSRRLDTGGLLMLARERGLDALIRRTHGRRRVVVHTPWHDRPVRLADETDVEFITAELSAPERGRRAERLALRGHDAGTIAERAGVTREHARALVAQLERRAA